MEFQKGDLLTPHQAIELAIQEAKKGVGFVSPNPPVGCVILDKNQRLLSVGYHKKCGDDHAEIDALNKVHDLELLRGAHLYVTLEPCSHQGKTPPCVNRLTKLLLGSVNFVLQDPNPLVNGQGEKVLLANGITVKRMSEFEQEVRDLMEVYLYNLKYQKPFIVLKVASSLDGKIALLNGKSKWITGPQAREKAHFLRGCYDAVLVGRRTLEEDNPCLNLRVHPFVGLENKVIILDSQLHSLNFLKNSHLYHSHLPHHLFYVTSLKKNSIKSSQLQSLGVQCINVEKGGDDRFDLNQLLYEVYKMGITSLYVEGGGATISSFLKEHLFQKLYLFLAPKIIGKGLDWSHEHTLTSLDLALELQYVSTEMIDSDLFLIYKNN